MGSHLVDRLMLLGHDVVVMDNYVTGAKSAVAHWLGAWALEGSPADPCRASAF